MENIERLFGVRRVSKPGTYLGANLDFTSKKGSLFNRTLERVRSKLGK